MGNYPSSHKVRGPMSRAQSPRCRIEGPRFRVQGPWPKVQDPLFGVEGQRFQGPGRGFQGPGSRVQYFESSFKAQIGIPHGQRPPPLVGCHSGEKPQGPSIQGRSARARDQGPVSSMHAHRALSSSRKGSRFQGSKLKVTSRLLCLQTEPLLRLHGDWNVYSHSPSSPSPKSSKSTDVPNDPRHALPLLAFP